MMATSTQTDTAIQICDFTAFSEIPKNAFTRKCILIQRKNSSTCHLALYKEPVDIQLAGDAEQTLREVGVDPPVPRRVRIGQGVARDLAANPHVVELLALRAQTRFDVPQALAKRQLRNRHAQKLILTGEALDLMVAPIPRHASLQGLLGKVFHEPRKYQFPRMHQIPRLFGSGSPWHRLQLKSRTSSYA